MLPEFPWFKPIDLSDRLAVEELIAGYPPFADFNFVELWCWNRGEKGGISQLDGNLVVRWQDCITGELFLSFIGTNKVEKTASKLLAYARERGIEPRLQAVPDVVVDESGELGEGFVVEEDHVNSDYLLSVDAWAEMQGKKFKNKRNVLNGLIRDHNPELRQLDLEDAQVRSEIMELCHRWADQRGRHDEETMAEFEAIESLLVLAQELKLDRLRVFGAYVGSKLIGFSVNEILPDSYALGHFAKADYDYPGVFQFILQGVCKHLREQGVQYLNVEADLGDPGLAEAKHLMNPQGRLRKYVIVEAEPVNRGVITQLPPTWDHARSA
jgi:hypothetical protein